jgi:two-component system phosphate regulon response regulator PhoB
MKKLLIVDDHATIRKMLRHTLSGRFALEEFADADSAHAHLMTSRADGIVLDVMMPGSMNGYQLCERIKRDRALDGIHVVLITACGRIEDQELGRAVGADAYFVKPFSPQALLRHLSAVLLTGADGEAA